VWLPDDITPSGVVAWEFKYVATAVGESYIAAFLETLTVVSPTSPAWLVQAESILTLDPTLISASDDIGFTLSRDDSADTADLRVRLRGLFFEYQDV